MFEHGMQWGSEYQTSPVSKWYTCVRHETVQFLMWSKKLTQNWTENAQTFENWCLNVQLMKWLLPFQNGRTKSPVFWWIQFWNVGYLDPHCTLRILSFSIPFKICWLFTTKMLFWLLNKSWLTTLNTLKHSNKKIH